MLDVDRAELLELLISDGIFHHTPENPIVSRDKSGARWMLDSLRVSLTPHGAELAGRCLVALLDRFEGRQVATYGVTAIPLLAACIMQSGGRYRGLVVRKERKEHGSRKLIEGPIDPNEPTIILDDSVSSGLSMGQCVQTLEQAGLRVEGGVCLVRFGWFGGYARMQERGYHMEALYDVWRDFVPRISPDLDVVRDNPSLVFPPFEWAHDEAAAPEGIHPAVLARTVMERALDGRKIPRPPRRMDRDYDSAGGAWVSVRSRANLHLRHARDGFWVFPGEARFDAGEAVARAALRTAQRLTRAQLAESGVAVTFFGALEESTPGQLDNDRYGILAVSRERPGQLGGALPRMPGMSREWAQLEHARTKNGRLYPFEAFVVYRHTVTKAVEPETAWQPTGVPATGEATWHDDPARAGRVAARAYDLVRAQVSGEPERTAPLPDDLIPATESVFVSLFVAGHVAGCIGGRMAQLDDDLRRVARNALADPRFHAELTPDRAGDLAVTVSFLDGATPMGQQSPEDIAVRIRHGEQALAVFQGSRLAVLLPFVVLQQSLSPQQYVAELIDKAGITRPPYGWALYDCATWLADRDPPRKLVRGLPPGTPPATLDAAVAKLTPLLLGYLLRHRRPEDGYYRAFLDQTIGELDLPRQIHGAWTLARAHRVLGDARLLEPAREGIDAVLARAGDGGGLLEAAFLLLCACELERPDTDALAAKLAEKLWTAIDRHGRVVTDEPKDETDPEQSARRADALQDYLPAQTLLALAVAVARGKTAVDREAAERAIRYYRHRFRYKRGWGQVSWLGQAAAAWWKVTRDPAHAALAFEIADWALDYQQDKTGGFINGEQPDSPGYTTGVYLEGVAAALGIAVALGDEERAARYRRSCAAGLRFLDGLVYQERDRPLIPNPERACGGVRMSRNAGDVRVDFVHHALNVMVELVAYDVTPTRTSRPSITMR